MSRPTSNSVLTQDNVRQWRDFLDVLLFARQNRAEIVVPDRFPGLDNLLELQNNTQKTLESINFYYDKNYRDLRAFRGKFDNLSSLLVLQNLKISSGRNFKKDRQNRLICYTSSNARVGQLETDADFLAIAMMNDNLYMGTKIFMKAHMIELVSL
ncbi:hypothetical protein GC194_03520 [bacterium]|nr:hypothetical protein [bacterium]